MNRNKDHNISIIKSKCRPPNERSKNQLIDRVIYAQRQTDMQLNEFLQEVAIFFTEFNKRIKETIKKATQFKVLCNDIINEIQNMNSLDIKEIYSPFENLLLSTNNDKILSLIQSPTIIFPQINIQNFYIPTCFPHFLYNYSDNPIYFEKHDTIKVYSLNKSVQSDRFSSLSRYLDIGNNQFLFTGGYNPAQKATFIIDLVTENIVECSNLLTPRRAHSITWIYNSPAVIGGVNGQGIKINSMEIFKNNYWINGPSINISRSSHSSISYQNVSYIIGGVNNSLLESIEKFSNGEWKLLEINLLMPCVSITPICIENNLLVIGGNTSNDKIESSDRMFIINPIDLKIEELRRFNEPIRNTYNQIKINLNEILLFGLDANSKLITRDIKLNLSSIR